MSDRDRQREIGREGESGRGLLRWGGVERRKRREIGSEIYRENREINS